MPLIQKLKDWNEKNLEAERQQAERKASNKNLSAQRNEKDVSSAPIPKIEDRNEKNLEIEHSTQEVKQHNAEQPREQIEQIKISQQTAPPTIEPVRRQLYNSKPRENKPKRIPRVAKSKANVKSENILKKLPLRYYTLIGLTGAVIALLSFTVFLSGTAGFVNLPYPEWFRSFFGTPMKRDFYPSVAYTLLFLGYFVHQSKWTRTKKLTLGAVVLSLLHTISYGNLLSVSNSDLERYIPDAQDFLALFRWVLFCVGLLLHKNIDKLIKWFAVIIIIILSASHRQIIIIPLVRFSQDFMRTVFIMIYVVPAIITALLAIFLAYMFVLQCKNSRKMEGN